MEMSWRLSKSFITHGENTVTIFIIIDVPKTEGLYISEQTRMR